MTITDHVAALIADGLIEWNGRWDGDHLVFVLTPEGVVRAVEMTREETP